MSVRFVLMLIAVGLIFAPAASPEDPSNPPPFDLAPLIEAGAGKITIIGEIHGTQEAPAFFASLVAHALERTSDQILVGLELQTDFQKPLKNYLSSDGTVSEQKALLEAGRYHWIEPDSPHHGRSSEAIFGIIETLRQLSKRRLNLRVVTFDTRSLATQPPELIDESMEYLPEPDERAMADAYLSRWEQGDYGRGFIFVGDVHAMIEKFRDFRPMAMHFPEGTILSLRARFNGGTVWNSATNGVRPIGAPDDYPEELGFKLFEDARWHGEIYVGVGTASHPMAYKFWPPEE